MEIRNNTPMYSRQSFGMAFIKVDGEDLAKFTDFVVDGANDKAKALRGVRQLVKEQAGNKHFDIKYVYRQGWTPEHRFEIVPTSEKAKSMYKLESVHGDYFTHYEKVCQEVKRDVARAGKIAKPFVKIKGAFKKLFARIACASDARQAAPGSMRIASQQATTQSRVVDAQIADEATITKIFE